MALIDTTLAPIQETLKTNLSWLTEAYGKIERREKIRSEKVYRYPAVFAGGENVPDWTELLPDENLGNYCYFEIEKDGEYEAINRNANPKFRFKLVFFWDWRTIYPTDWKARSIEEIKAQILQILMAAPYTRMIRNWKWSEDADTIYRGFSHLEIERQFFMRPYGGVAFMGEISGSDSCPLDLPIPTIPISMFGTWPANYSGTEQVLPYFKWYGQPIHWRTFSLGSGNDGFKTITGLSASDVSQWVDMEYRAVLPDGAPVITKISPELNGSGGWQIPTRAFESSIFVTLFYVKT
jgi:hypothetical protein